VVAPGAVVVVVVAGGAVVVVVDVDVVVVVVGPGPELGPKTVTRVPIGVRGQMRAALAMAISTHPLL
jgi:hypothetical protein